MTTFALSMCITIPEGFLSQILGLVMFLLLHELQFFLKTLFPFSDTIDQLPGSSACDVTRLLFDSDPEFAFSELEVPLDKFCPALLD